MKKRVGYIFLIFVLVFGLILLISVAQILAKKNISGLNDGNADAAITFTINNRLQEVVNLSFDLESKVLNSSLKKTNHQSLADSLTMLGYNIKILDGIKVSKQAAVSITHLKKLIDKQVLISNRILNPVSKGSFVKGKIISDSLLSMHFYDSVFSTAVIIKKSLEQDLQTTLDKNKKESLQLSASNKILAFIAIFAVLLLATIILNRHLKQVELIQALEKAKNEAQQSAQIKNQFMANMSHEIRTPLNAISGYSKILLQTNITEQQQQYANIIHEASDNLIYIVNDILDLSKIEAGKLSVQQKVFNLEKLVQTIQYMFANTVAEKQLQFVQKINANVPLNLKGDPDRILQILVNLVSNAIKFTRAGEVTLTISCFKETETTVKIEFTVADTGIGIPGDQKENIFNRFEQLKPPEDFVTKGTGLGLNIVKNLVEIMHGEIIVTSEQGKGSTFIARIPFLKASNTVDHTEEKLILTKNADQYKGNSILIVEDNKVNQLLLKHLLEGNGATIDVANNGAEALTLIGSNFYSLIFLDIQMPVMNGYQLIQKLRNEMNVTIPVIAMTAFALEGEKEKCNRAGMTDYITKPLQFAELSSMLKKYAVQYSTKKEDHKLIQPEFLMQLAGNNKNIADEIIKEISKEIPIASSILATILSDNDIASLPKTLHHMVSTFSPLGNETTVMKQIQQLQIHVQTDDTATITQEIYTLIKELAILNKALSNNFFTIGEALHA